MYFETVSCRLNKNTKNKFSCSVVIYKEYGDCGLSLKVNIISSSSSLYRNIVRSSSNVENEKLSTNFVSVTKFGQVIFYLFTLSNSLKY